MTLLTNDDYRALIRSALDGFWLLDGQGRFLDVNDAYCELIGYTRAELLTMSIADVEANETPAIVAQHIQQVKTNGTGRFTTQHRTRAGRLVDIEISTNYEAAHDWFFVFLRDITARQVAETLLRQRTHELTERVKELRCLMDLSTLMTRPELAVEDVLKRAVDLLPVAWQYPAITAAELKLPGLRYATPNFQLTPWYLTCELEVGGDTLGQLTVVYLENAPAGKEGPFLWDERRLLEAVAQRLSNFIQRRRIEEALLLREMSMNSLLDLSQRASALAERDIIQLALEEVERLTFSQIGYLHFVNPDQNTIQLFTWSRQTLEECTAVHATHYPLTQAGVWADCARLKRPVVHNDYQNHPDKKGYPAGHAHLVRHLSVPVVEDDQVKLILGVGNKPLDYDEADTRQLLLTAEHLWRIVRRKRAEDETRREAQRVATLARVAARLNAQLDLPTVLQTVCEETAQALGFPAASVCLYQTGAHTLCHTAAASNEMLANTAEVQAELLALLDAGPWDGDLFVLPPPAAGRWIGALAAARLIHADENLGVLTVYTFGTARPWVEEESALMRGLAHQVAQAITNARLFAEVSLSRENLQALSRRLVEVQETERRHIARELHDEVGQLLTAVKINLQTLRRQPILTTYTPRLDDDIDHVQRALEQVRNLSLDLRPSILDDLGLGAALEWYANRLAPAAGLKPQLTLPPEAPRWSPTIEITCFRVAQEALTNILRHAHAQHVWIEVAYSPQELRVRVRDDGQGFEPATARLQAARSGTSLGLLSMAERVALAGGRLEIDSAPGQGANVQVIFTAPALRSPG